MDSLPKKKPMKRLTCRKCEGHGVVSILKGHAALCQFNECQCDTCKTVMSLRANALIRRFRHRQPGQNAAVLRTIRSKNGNMRLRILPKNEVADDSHGTTIRYSDDSSSQSSGSVSPMGLPCSPVPSSPDPRLMECLQQLLCNQMVNELLRPLIQPPNVQMPPLLVPQMLLPQLLNC